MFLGTHTPRLDDKGRLFLPARFREDLAAGLVITKGQERCLVIYPAAEFERMTTTLRDAPTTAKRIRDYNRVLFPSASREVPDRQGRITVPPPLRVYAGLIRDCTVVGVQSRVEVWDSETWERYQAEAEASFSAIDEEVLHGVL